MPGPGSWALVPTTQPTLAGASFTHEASNLPGLVLGKAGDLRGRLPVQEGAGMDGQSPPCLV